MCGQCRGLSRLPDWYVHILGEDLRERRLARTALAAAATRAFASAQVAVACPPGSADYAVRGSTGRSLTASSVDEVITAAEQLAGQPFDPLAEQHWGAPS